MTFWMVLAGPLLCMLAPLTLLIRQLMRTGDLNGNYVLGSIFFALEALMLVTYEYDWITERPVIITLIFASAVFGIWLTLQWTPPFLQKKMAPQ